MNDKRFFTLITLAVAIGAPNAWAQWWNPSDLTPKKDWGTQCAPKVVYTHQTTLDAETAANTALWGDDFAKLDRMYGELLDVRATDGTSMVAPIARIFRQAGSSRRIPERHDLGS